MRNLCLSDDFVFCFCITGVKLGNGGIILVHFEQPSGFAIFSYDGVILLQPNAIEVLVFTNALVLLTWLLVCCSRPVRQTVNDRVNDRGLFTAGWFSMREKYCFSL